MKDVKVLILVSSMVLSAFLMFTSVGAMGSGSNTAASSSTNYSSPMAVTNPGVI